MLSLVRLLSAFSGLAILVHLGLTVTLRHLARFAGFFTVALVPSERRHRSARLGRRSPRLAGASPFRGPPPALVLGAAHAWIMPYPARPVSSFQ